jgi:hypothetical protein
MWSRKTLENKSSSVFIFSFYSTKGVIFIIQYMSCELLSGISSGIWLNLGEPSDLAVSTIYAKIASSGMLGQLDVAINGCHYFNESGCVVPSFTAEELGMYEQLYYISHYMKKANQTQSSVTSNYWVSLAEADTKITKANPNTATVNWTILYKDAKQSFDDMVSSYRANNSLARSVDFYGIDPYGSSNSVSNCSRQ